MGQLVLGVVVNVLMHVFVKHFECLGVEAAAAASGDFAVLNAGEFVVLLPEIGFEDFSRRQKAQNGDITHGDDAAAILRFGFAGQEGAGRQGRTDYAETFQERPSPDVVRGWRGIFFGWWISN